MSEKKTLPIKFYSDLHKAYLIDLNRCPSCGEIVGIGASGNIYCSNDNCKYATSNELGKLGQLSKEAKELYNH